MIAAQSLVPKYAIFEGKNFIPPQKVTQSPGDWFFPVKIDFLDRKQIFLIFSTPFSASREKNRSNEKKIAPFNKYLANSEIFTKNLGEIFKIGQKLTKMGKFFFHSTYFLLKIPKMRSKKLKIPIFWPKNSSLMMKSVPQWFRHFLRGYKNIFFQK